MTETVATYARLSRLKGRDENIATQQRKAGELARDRYPGCVVVEYTDPSASAEDETVVREAYERMKADILEGKITQVVTGDQERLTRRPDELERLITVLRTAGIAGFLGYRDGWTQVSEGAAEGARYKSVGHKQYVEGIKVKVNEKLEANAQAGIPSGAKVYGYKPVTRLDENGKPFQSLEIVEDEAEHVRWMVDEVLRGKPAHAVAQELNAKGVKTPRGGRTWRQTTVKAVLLAPARAGLLVYRGEIIGKGNWDPIVTEEQHQALVAKLTTRTVNSPRESVRRYLLSGFLRCSRCDVRMSGNWAVDRGHHRYHCPECSVAINGPKVDRYVLAELLPKLDALHALLTIGGDQAARRDEITAELADIGRDRRLYGERMGRKELDWETYESLRETLTERESGLRRELESLPKPEAVPSPHAARQALAGMDIAEQRRTLGRYVERINVDPVGRGHGRRFDTGRVHIMTRAAASADAEAVQALTTGRRSYVERTSGQGGDWGFDVALRFLELSEIEG